MGHCNSREKAQERRKNEDAEANKILPVIFASRLQANMREQQFLRNQRSAAARPQPPNPHRTGIQIDWGEAAATSIKIQRHPVGAAVQGRFRQQGRPGGAALLALSAKASMVFASRKGRRAI